MTILRSLLATVLGATLVAGCTYYQTAPGVYTSTPTSTFDRSWAAARNAMLEEGVRITQEDRSSGTLGGDRQGIGVLALIRSQADGSIRVEFRTIGATTVDPQLIERISSSYDRQMGR
jgi:hypothetical protein